MLECKTALPGIGKAQRKDGIVPGAVVPGALGIIRSGGIVERQAIDAIVITGEQIVVDALPVQDMAEASVGTDVQMVPVEVLCGKRQTGSGQDHGHENQAETAHGQRVRSSAVSLGT